MSKRRFFSIFMALSLLFMIPTAAYGDIVVEPDNDFYWQHADECKSVNRAFFLDAQDGSTIAVLEEPGTGTELAQMPNETGIWISSSYELNGELWGNTWIQNYQSPTGKDFYGWVSMSDLTLIYDEISFREEFGSTFYSEGKDLDKLEQVSSMIYWEWPGSGYSYPAIDKEITMKNGFIDFYMDDKGREWGYFRNTDYWSGWVCISDPESTSIEEFNILPRPGVADSASVQVTRDSVSEGFPGTIWVIGALVVVLVAVTGVLIRVFWKQKKPTPPQS